MSSSPGSYDLVTQFETITAYFQQVLKERKLLFVSFPNEPRVKSLETNILTFGDAKEIILRHPEISADTNTILSSGTKVEIRCAPSSGSLIFTTTLSSQEKEGQLYLVIDMPKEISRRQLRSAYRTSVLKHNVPVSISDEHSSFESQATCLDLSRGGCACILRSDTPPGIAVDQILQLHIKLGSSLTISSSAIIRDLKPTASYRYTARFSFIDLENKLAAQLDRYLIKVEQQQLQRVSRSPE